ncbi:MAG TPA: transposase, partial [Candidatus Mediterraneibacter intestinigallinarum]|nr:transposase [Candidatus Mediterraneibacter intestinigallinarum]
MCMKQNLIRSRTCVYNINYHVVWSVKYRAEVLTPDLENRMQEIAAEIASEKGFTV